MHYYFIPLSDLFINPALNLIQSIKKYDKNIFIYIGNLGLNDYNYKRIHEIAKTKLLIMPDEYINQIHTARWPKAYMMKYILPWLIDDRIKRILCLGADMLINGVIDELFEIPIENKAIAASIELSGNLLSERCKLFNGMPADKLYVNAEMLLINCDYFRNKYTPQIIMNGFYEIQDRIKFYDQDFMNIYFYKQIIPISPRYNCQLRELKHTSEAKQELREAKIIHYSIAPKPWSWKCNPMVIRHYYLLSDKCYKKWVMRELIYSILMYCPYRILKSIKKIL